MKQPNWISEEEWRSLWMLLCAGALLALGLIILCVRLIMRLPR
jgi:hypothetical protein